MGQKRFGDVLYQGLSRPGSFCPPIIYSPINPKPNLLNNCIILEIVSFKDWFCLNIFKFMPQMSLITRSINYVVRILSKFRFIHDLLMHIAKGLNVA